MPAPFPPQRPECLSDEWIVLRREVLARSEEARSRSADLRHMGEALRRRSAELRKSA